MARQVGPHHPYRECSVIDMLYTIIVPWVMSRESFGKHGIASGDVLLHLEPGGLRARRPVAIRAMGAGVNTVRSGYVFLFLSSLFRRAINLSSFC